MGILGRLAGAVVRRGASLFRRGAAEVASDVGDSKIRRRLVGEAKRVLKQDGMELRRRSREALSPDRRNGTLTSSAGPIKQRTVGTRTRVNVSDGQRLNVRPTEATRRSSYRYDVDPGPPVVRAAARRAAMSPISAARRRASVVGRRYFTQGGAGKLNLKGQAAVGAGALAVGIPIVKVAGETIGKSIANKRAADALAAQPKQQTQTYQQGADKLAAQSSATATGAVPSSTESSASTDTSPVTRTNSTTGVSGVLQDDMRASAAAVRPDRDYMGEAFDATLRKGVTSGRAYLKGQLARDKADVNKTKTTLAAYDKRVGKDTLLGRDRGVGYLKNADSDQTQKDLLSAYRGRFGAYRKNARASEIEAMAQAAAAKRGS